MSHYLVQQIEAIANIEIHPHTEVAGGEGEKHLQRLILRDNRTDALTTVRRVVAFRLHRSRTAHAMAGRRRLPATSGDSC